MTPSHTVPSQQASPAVCSSRERRSSAADTTALPSATGVELEQCRSEVCTVGSTYRQDSTARKVPSPTVEAREAASSWRRHLRQAGQLVPMAPYETAAPRSVVSSIPPFSCSSTRRSQRSCRHLRALSTLSAFGLVNQHFSRSPRQCCLMQHTGRRRNSPDRPQCLLALQRPPAPAAVAV